MAYGAPPIATQEMCLVGNANPFTTNWVDANQNIYMGGQNAEYESAVSLKPMWWNLTVYVLGEGYTTVDPLPISSTEQANNLCTQARNSGNQSSILKAEITYPTGQSRQRSFRLDVEHGRNVFVPPTTKVFVNFLRPNAPANSPVPAGFDRDVFFVSDVVVSVRCVDQIMRIPGGDWSSSIIISDPGDAVRDLPVEEGAIEVSACFNSVPANPIEFVLQRRDLTGAVIDETILASASPVAGSTCIPRTDIPGGTNIIRYSQPLGPFPIQGTITQHLEF